mgnify:FL=1
MKRVGVPYSDETFEILDRNQIEKIIEDLEPGEIVRKAYDGYIPGMKSGYAAINLMTGELETESLGQGEGHMGSDALWVSVYHIDQNPVDWPNEDIYSPEEIEEYEKSEACEDGYGIDEYFEDIDYEEREIEPIIHYYDDHQEFQDIEQQLDSWYGKEA